jgi:hypothetical protein
LQEYASVRDPFRETVVTDREVSWAQRMQGHVEMMSDGFHFRRCDPYDPTGDRTAVARPLAGKGKGLAALGSHP